MLVIPLKDTPNQKCKVLIDGQEVSLHIYQRNAMMYLDMLVGSEKVCSGAKCVHGRSVIPFMQQKFKGSLHFMDVNGSESPQWQGLGTRWHLVYFAQNEVIRNWMLF